MVPRLTSSSTSATSASDTTAGTMPSKSIRVFDAEFAFFGPFGFDVGMLIANFFFAYARAMVHVGSAGRPGSNAPPSCSSVNWTEHAERIVRDVAALRDAHDRVFLTLWREPHRTSDGGLSVPSSVLRAGDDTKQERE